MCREVLLRATEAVAAEMGVCVVLFEVIRKTFFLSTRTPLKACHSCIKLHRVYVEKKCYSPTGNMRGKGHVLENCVS